MQQYVNSPYLSAYSAPQQGQDSRQQSSLQQQPSAQQQQQPLNVPVYPTFPGQAIQNDYNAQGKPKRKQVKNACVNCQKACKKCDDGRPCQRCVKYGLSEHCSNSVRKERKKGIKRGPYKKRKQDSSAASTPSLSTPTLPNGLYSPTAVSGPSVTRSNAVPIQYQPFGYDLQSVNYQASQPMIPPGYMLYNNNILTTYQQTLQSMMNPPQAQQQQHQQAAHQQQSSNASQDKTMDDADAKKTPDADEEGNKLNLLSQLCSAVLDRSDAPSAKDVKEEDEQMEQDQDNKETQNTPPSSRPRSRDMSEDSSSPSVKENVEPSSETPNTSFIDGEQMTKNSGSNSAYGTPGSSPSVSTTDRSKQATQDQGQKQVWPLPPLSAVPADSMQQDQD